MACPFCRSIRSSSYNYPSTTFNGKQFSYVRCSECRLVYLNPLPDELDLAAMYPPSYQGNIDTAILPDPKKKLPGLRFSYQAHFDLAERSVKGKKMLDYGCGTANFLVNAAAHGYSCDGVEFNPSYVKKLGTDLPAHRFYTLEQFNVSKETYDVIRLSNVLEHLTDPATVLKDLMTKLNEGGILIVEGPIEANFTFAQGCMQLFFLLKKFAGKNTADHVPFHIFFSSAANQRKLFRDCGLRELHYEIAEFSWPNPESLKEAKGVSGVTKWMLARFSRFLSGLNSSWGNTFLYAGKK